VFAVRELILVLLDGVREGWAAADFRSRLAAWREVIRDRSRKAKFLRLWDRLTEKQRGLVTRLMVEWSESNT
jgi:hypothetical protein